MRSMGSHGSHISSDGKLRIWSDYVDAQTVILPEEKVFNDEKNFFLKI